MLAFFRARMINGCRAKAATAISKGNIEEALMYITSAIEYDKSFAPSYRDQGIAFLLSQQYTFAEKSLLKAIALNNNEIEARDALAATYSEQGKLDAARATYEEALQLVPHYASFYFNYAKFLKEDGQYVRAKSYFEQALTLEPGEALRDKIMSELVDEQMIE